jgi:hypothetical protein
MGNLAEESNIIVGDLTLQFRDLEFLLTDFEAG